jgi:hypothetical protein
MKLADVFADIAAEAPEATKVRLEENMIHVTAAVVYVGPVESEHQRACPNGKLLPYLPNKPRHKNITDVDHLRPEKLFRPESVKLPTEVLAKYAVEGMAGDLYITFGNIPGRTFELLLMVASEVNDKKIWRIVWRSEASDHFKIAYKRFLLSTLEPRLCSDCISGEYDWKIQTSYRVNNPVLAINNKTETLYHLLKYIKDPAALPDFIVDDDYGQIYCPDGWKDSTRDFTKLRTAKAKEVKMSDVKMLGKLPMPDIGTAKKKEEAGVAPAADQSAVTSNTVKQSAVQEPSQPAAPISTSKVSDTPELQTPPAEAVQPEIANAPAEEEKPKRQRRMKQATTVGFNFDEVIEYLGHPVTLGAADIPAAVNEVRIIRDLQIAAARRMANICTGLNEIAGPAMEKCGKIKDLMNN